MTAFTVTAERGTRWWVLQCVEYPGAISEVARLDQAEASIREAIAFVAGVPEDSFEVHVQPVLPDSIREHIATAERLREESREANRGAAEEVRAAARALQAQGLSLRDVGTVLEVSYQRAHQLVS
jgi:hypothetical protein